MDIKSGWRTSEFWKSFLVSIVTMLCLFGLVPHEAVSDLTKAIGEFVGAIVVIVNTCVYVNARLTLKQTAIDAQATIANSQLTFDTVKGAVGVQTGSSVKE